MPAMHTDLPLIIAAVVRRLARGVTAGCYLQAGASFGYIRPKSKQPRASPEALAKPSRARSPALQLSILGATAASPWSFLIQAEACFGVLKPQRIKKPGKMPGLRTKFNLLRLDLAHERREIQEPLWSRGGQRVCRHRKSATWAVSH